MWFAHLAAFVLFFILFLFLHAYGETEAGAFAFVMAFMSLLTLALMANLAYKDEGWGKGMLDSEKAFRLGRPLLMFYRLFLAFGILAEIVPGMAALISEEGYPETPAITDTDRGGTLNPFHPDPYHSQVFRHQSNHSARPARFE